jgi:hypothetical protein
LGIWEKGIGLIGRVGEDYPQEWLKQIEKRGFDIRGIKVFPENYDLRSFIAYDNFERIENDNPITHFSRLGLSLPKHLLGYLPPSQREKPNLGIIESTIRLQDIPNDYTDTTAAHICPMDYRTQSLLCSTFRQKHINTITLDPPETSMEPDYWEKMGNLLKEVSALLVSESKLTRLFKSRSVDIWEMMEGIASFGCEIVVVKRGSNGQYLYERTGGKKWMIPAYSTRLVDPTGIGDTFDGGFLAGYRSTYDPLNAVIYGNISSSLKIEGSGPFYGLDSLPELADARRHKLQEMVRRV